jgi:SAM-dependent methyltransferase
MTDRELQRSFLIDRLAPKRGESILDLGCGGGEDLLKILRLRPGVRAVGMDSMEKMLQAARKRLHRHIKRGTAELVSGDAGQELPFPSKSFDAVFSVELLECLPSEKQVLLLREIRRVLKPGGRVLAAHTDWDTQVWNSSDRVLERKLVHAFCDWTQGWMQTSDGWMGRRLIGLFRRSNHFKGTEVSAHTLINDTYKPGTFGYARSQDLLELARKGKKVRLAEARRFLRDLGRQHRARSYFYSVTRYFVLARRGKESS